jgi:hypothetical protein
MNLRLFLEQTGQSWTLKPGKTYLVGSGMDCDIALSQFPDVADRHLKLNFDQVNRKWFVEDLGNSVGTLIDGVVETTVLIERDIQIQLANGVMLVARPESAPVAAVVPPAAYTPPAPQNYAPPPRTSNYSTDTVRNDGFREVVRSQNGFTQSNQPVSGALETLSWAQYVRSQVEQHESLFMRLATRFSLITGWRNTPWLFNNSSVEGYVIPDFKGSIETVVRAIESQVGKLRQYEDTDCIAANLTDAHIANSAIESFAGVELFAIRRGKNATRGDYRRFCVTSYHHVRNYLIIEKYGPDLFVSWITRFEPTPTPAVMQLWLVLASFMTLLMLASSNIGLIITPLTIWAEIYLLVPAIMDSTGTLPKKANTRLIAGVILFVTGFILMALIGTSAYSSMFGGSRY